MIDDNKTKGDESLGSISRMLVAARIGDRVAESQLWARCSPKLLRVARSLLNPTDRIVADEEDIVLACFESLFRRLASGRLESLTHRSALWKLLNAAVRSESISHVRYLRSQRRSATDDHGGQRMPEDPARLVEYTDTLEHLLQVLPNEEVRRICVMKLDGFKNTEIAKDLGQSLATVERRLALIRTYWGRESSDGRA